MMNRKNLVIIIIVALIVAGGIASYFSYKKGYLAGYEEGIKVGRAAVKVKPEEAVINPMEKMPQTNPFEEVVNPFKELYKNPFK